MPGLLDEVDSDYQYNSCHFCLSTSSPVTHKKAKPWDQIPLDKAIPLPYYDVMQSHPKTTLFTNMDEVWDYYRDDLLRVEDRIKKSLDSQVSLINQVAYYILSSGGKRIRPLLLIITSKLNDRQTGKSLTSGLANGRLGGGGIGEWPEGAPHRSTRIHDEAEVLLASAVEFIHTATLLHDDVIDQAEVRRGKKSAHTLWGNQASILVGDYLYTQAVSLALTLSSQEVNTTLADACRLMTEGETFQLTQHGNLEVTEQDYLKVIQHKTASLLSATCRLGSIISGLDSNKQDALAQFGLYLGIAYQLADDTLDYIADQELLGKSLGKDLNEGKITLPLLHLLSYCGEQERARVKNIVNADRISDRDLQEILALMKRYGSIEYSLKKARETVEIAKKNLDCSPPSLHRQALSVVADYVVSRDH
jgi:octaprenyl-diphosphate synthase